MGEHRLIWRFAHHSREASRTSRVTYLIVVALGVVIAGAQMLLLPAFLTPTALGAVAIAMSVIQAVNQFGDLGLINAANRIDLRSGSRSRLRETGVTLTTYIAAALALTGAVALSAGVLSLELAAAIVFGAFAGWAVTFNRARAATAAAAGDEPAALWLGARWQHSYKVGITIGALSGSALLAFVAASLAVVAAGARFKMILTPQLEFLRRRRRIWMPGLMLSVGTFAIGWVDSYSIGVFMGLENVGAYQAILRPLLAATFLYLPLLAVLQSAISAGDHARVVRLRASIILITLAYVLVAVPGLIFGGAVIWPDYSFPAVTVALSGLSVVAGAWSAAFGMELLLGGRALTCAIANLLGAGIVILSTALLTPHLGLSGAAGASFGGWAVAAVLQTIAVRARRPR